MTGGGRWDYWGHDRVLLGCGSSEGLGGQVLSVEGDDRAVAALRVGHLLDVELELDAADDAVTELLVN